MKRYLFIAILILTTTMTLSCGGDGGDSSSPGLVVGSMTIPQLVEPTSHGDGTGWKNDQCFLCHPISSLKDIHSYNKKLGESFEKVGENNTGVCFYCHGNNGLDVNTIDYECTLCHENSNIVNSADQFVGIYKHDLTRNGVLGNDDCVICHEISDMNGKIEVGVDFRQSDLNDYKDITDFCLNCHNSYGAFGVKPSELKYDKDFKDIYSTYMGVGSTEEEKKRTADVHGFKDGVPMSFGVFRGEYDYNMEVPCISCHDVHTSDNPYLITQSGAKAELSDKAGKNAEVKVVGNNFSELCAVCHTNPAGNTLPNGLQEVVHTSPYSSNCVECHYHGAGFDNESENMF